MSYGVRSQCVTFHFSVYIFRYTEYYMIFVDVPLVGEHHQAVVSLAADDTPDALRRLPQCVERQEVVFPDLVLRAKVVEAREEDLRLGVPVRGETGLQSGDDR